MTTNDKTAGNEREAFEALLIQWEARRRNSIPVDAMIAGKHIRELREVLASLTTPSKEPAGAVAEWIAIGDGTLHGAIDHWQERATTAQALADSEGTRAVEYLRRARKVEAKNARALECLIELKDRMELCVREGATVAEAYDSFYAEMVDGAINALAAPGAAIDAREQGEASGYRVFKDGDQWCAVGPDFIDLQQSPAGFADTPGEALEQLMKEFGKEWAKKNGEWVKRARIASPDEPPAVDACEQEAKS